jgi:hypothetical protein
MRDRSCLVTYLLSHPEIHCFGDAHQRLEMHNRKANIFAPMLAVGFSILFLWVEFNLRRELRLAAIGELAEGQIIEKRSYNSRKRRIYQVRYLFDAPDGQRSGWQTVGEYLWGYLHPGTAVTVLYDLEHPGRHRPSFGLDLVQFLPRPAEE